MKFVFNDGGRAAAGRKGKSRDCGVRAVAIALRLPYNEVYRTFATFLRKPKSLARHGLRTDGPKFIRFMASHGYFYINIRSLDIVFGETGLPAGRILVETPGHISAVINGVLHDSFNAAAGRPWKIFGFWRKSKFSDIQRKQFDKFFIRGKLHVHHSLCKKYARMLFDKFLGRDTISV